MARQFDLPISAEATEDIEAIRDFGEARQKGLGFKYLEDILNCLEVVQHNLFNIIRLQKSGSVEE